MGLTVFTCKLHEILHAMHAASVAQPSIPCALPAACSICKAHVAGNEKIPGFLEFYSMKIWSKQRPKRKTKLYKEMGYNYKKLLVILIIGCFFSSFIYLTFGLVHAAFSALSKRGGERERDRDRARARVRARLNIMDNIGLRVVAAYYIINKIKAHQLTEFTAKFAHGITRITELRAEPRKGGAIKCVP